MDRDNVQGLQERAKELECVYAVDEVLQDRSLTIPKAMTRLVEIIPGGFSTPDATRIRIRLWDDIYETPGFDGARIGHSEPIRMEGEEVGALAVGYTAQLEAETFFILPYEIKMLKTISQRISQLALGQQRDLALLLNILRQIDSDMLLRIGEKLRVYLENTVGDKVRALFTSIGMQDGASTYGESNVPLSALPPINAEAFAQKLVEGAARFLPQDTVIRLMDEWIREQRVLAFVKTVDRKDSRVGDILDAVRKYTASVPLRAQADAQYTQTETWLVAELSHRFLTDDVRVINRVIGSLHIADFQPMMAHIISSERSAGNIGGKGAGLFIASQILRHAARTNPLLADIQTPRTWYIATDQIVDFLHYNNLEELNAYKYNSTLHLRMTYDNVVKKVKSARLPPQTVHMLHVVLDDLPDTPLIVRSSSLLEDKYDGAFSGKYKSLFLANQGTRQARLDALVDAVLEVYSSMYNPDSIHYREERGLLNFTEQMGVLIQEVVGKRVGHYFLPLFAGVAFSNNILRWSARIRQEDGLVRLVPGLGTRAVDRVSNDYPVMFAPGQPQLLINQSPDDILHYSPKQIDLIDLELGRFTTVEASGFLQEMGGEIPGLSRVVSVYEDDFLSEKNDFSLDTVNDKMVVTFRQILTSSDIPVKIKRMLDVLSDTLQHPVDIEFAYDGEQLYLLQCRPQGTGLASGPAPIPQHISPLDILFTANRFISNGQLNGITYIVYVDGDAYGALTSRESLLAVGEAVGRLNDLLPRRRYILMGPGRWGSRGDIQLGVRVTYSDISKTAALIEIAKEKRSYVPELSFGTHFFQDLVESNILYIPLYPDQPDTVFREGYFLSGTNLLGEILPKYAWLSDVIKVIDVPAREGGRTLSVHMNGELGQAMAFFSTEQAAQHSADAFEGVQAKEASHTSQEHWRWRHYMAKQLAQRMDMAELGVKAIYLFGSTDTGQSGIGSDIDLILHVDSSPAQREALSLWLDGWSLALARINFLQTGYDAQGLLDIHLVTDSDIAAGDAYAVKIGSSTDPASLLRRREEG